LADALSMSDAAPAASVISGQAGSDRSLATIERLSQNQHAERMRPSMSSIASQLREDIARTRSMP